jgi:hypothetical protein
LTANDGLAIVGTTMMVDPRTVLPEKYKVTLAAMRRALFAPSSLDYSVRDLARIRSAELQGCLH